MKILIYFTLVCLAGVSCRREFDDDPDYRYDHPSPVFGDNLLLYSKVFRETATGNYLWFDLRNEVADFTKPALRISFERDLFDRNIEIDLRGRLYSYDNSVREVTFLDVPADLFGRGEHSADIVCSLDRSQAGCDEQTDESEREKCRRTYRLVPRRIEIREIDALLETGVPFTWQNSTVTLSEENGQDLFLIN